MSPRPRRVETDAVLDAAERVMRDGGPAQFTLDEVGRQVGVSAPALMRRFGSKRGLELALKERAVRRTLDAVRALPPGGSPLAALIARFREGIKSTAPTPEAMAHSFASLNRDVTNEELRPLIMVQVASLRTSLRELVAAAVDAGELSGAPANTIADLIEATYNGALVLWVVERKGSAWSFVRPRLMALLAPYRSAAKKPRRARQ